MKLDKALISHVVSKTQDPIEIAERLNDYLKIIDDIKLCNKAIMEEEDKHKLKIKDLKDKIKQLRSNCDHPAGMLSHYSEYEERWTECGICGKSF